MKFCDFAYDLHYAESPPLSCLISSFFFNDTATTEIYTLSLHDALPIGPLAPDGDLLLASTQPVQQGAKGRSEEHTSELQSRFDLVCRLLLEKKNGYVGSFAETVAPPLRDVMVFSSDNS